jgi:nucleoside 2-deoxyribosyltransferase
MRSVYLAGPLFSLAEQDFNRRLADALRLLDASLQIILPQERCLALLPLPNGLALAYQDCVDMLRQCDVVLAILDGADADSGTCVELGIAHGYGRPIIGVRTDFRALEDRGLNLMVSHICTALVLPDNLTLPALALKVLAQINQLIP